MCSEYNILNRDDFSGRFLQISLPNESSIQPSKIGWMEGSCDLELFDTNIHVSKIRTGRWFLAYISNDIGTELPILDPFSVFTGRGSCFYYEVSHDNFFNELKLSFKCRDAKFRLSWFEKCQMYVKFTADQRIKYEVAHGCDLTSTFWSVYLAKTDYDNYIVIRGCLNLIHQNSTYHDIVQKVLIKDNLNESLSKEVTQFLKPQALLTRYIPQDLNLDANQINPGCNCDVDLCKEPFEYLCYPMERLDAVVLTKKILITVITSLVIVTILVVVSSKCL